MLTKYLNQFVMSVLLVIGVSMSAVAHEALPHVHTEYWNSAVVIAVLALVMGVLGNKYLK
ncbi:MAG: hypothetical protein COB51_13675 [Moraxellaceae bacterium]|nr:MAG: hypothetical protein COB51_13675 [Moraxellaceae bacterium]